MRTIFLFPNDLSAIPIGLCAMCRAQSTRDGFLDIDASPDMAQAPGRGAESPPIERSAGAGATPAGAKTTGGEPMADENLARARGWAASYLSLGWVTLPIPFRTKKATEQGYTGRTVESARASLDHDFPIVGAQNVAVLLGTPSGHLVDVDLDCRETVLLAPDFLPATPMKFGRASKPRSHWLYVAAFEKTEQFRDPTAPKGEPAMLVEIRSTGGYTVFLALCTRTANRSSFTPGKSAPAN